MSPWRGAQDRTGPMAMPPCARRKVLLKVGKECEAETQLSKARHFRRKRSRKSTTPSLRRSLSAGRCSASTRYFNRSPPRSG